MTVAGLIALAAVLLLIGVGLLLLHAARGPVRVPPAHPKRVQDALDETGDEWAATVFQFPDRS